jgi:hypothetical protein
MTVWYLTSAFIVWCCLVRYLLYTRKSKRTRTILDAPRRRCRRRTIMVLLPQTLKSRVAEVCSHFSDGHPGTLPDTRALCRFVSQCATLAQGLQQVEILAQVRGLQGGSAADLVQFLSGVVDSDALSIDAMSWCAHGLTAVSVPEYSVNVEARLGMRLQSIRSPKDFLTVQRAAFTCKPPLTVVQLELNERAAEQSVTGRPNRGRRGGVCLAIFRFGCPVAFLTMSPPQYRMSRSNWLLLINYFTLP